MATLDDLFWEASVDELKQGFHFDPERERYICLACGETFLEGVIYPGPTDSLLTAGRAIRQHVVAEHNGMFHYLLELGKQVTGISEVQSRLLAMFWDGLSDKEIVEMQGLGSTSTIRNHRFRLREKEKQARIFLAVMALLQDNKDMEEMKFVHVHKGATMVDDRYVATQAEEEQILTRYFKNGLDGPLSMFPAKEKRKLMILRNIVRQHLEAGRRYSEGEISNILAGIYHDFATIRRYLVEYGFINRTRNGSAYWLSES